MDTEDVMQEAEEILHVHHHPDATVYVVETVQPPIVDSSPSQSIATPPATPVVCAVLVALLLPLASILIQLHLLFSPLTATILVKTQQVTSFTHIYRLPAVTLTQRQTVQSSGHGHIRAAQAHGLVTFYNASTSPQTIDAGTLLVGRDGEQVITDQAAYIPAGTLNTNGSVTVWAHAVDYGPAGNIAADDIYGACCRLLVQAVNSAFSGGHNAKDYPLITQSDIATATSNLLAQENTEIDFRISPNETLLTPVPCSSHVTSNHKAGDEAAQVVVTVHQSCTPSVYKPAAMQASLMHLVARKTKQHALAALFSLNGVSSVAINWPDDMNLPPAQYIQLSVL